MSASGKTSFADATIPSRFHEEFRGNPNLPSRLRAKFSSFVGTRIAVHRRARKHKQRRRRPFPKVQPKTMYGDPFLSLVVAVLFAIVFYNISSIPTGPSYDDSQNIPGPRVRK
jgi:hypothetical protein